MITLIFLLIFEALGAIIGFMAYVTMTELDECINMQIADNKSIYKRDRLITTQTKHGIAANICISWAVISLVTFFFTLLANL